jgi:hypothetical protein
MKPYEIALGILGVVNTIAIGFIAFKRSGFQNLVDDSTAANNYQKLVIELQAKVDHMQALLDHSHLDVSMSIHMGEQPVITAWRWLRREEDSKIVTKE